MKNYGTKNKWKNILKSRPFLIFLFIVVLVFAWSVFGLFSKMRETIKNKNTAQAKITELQAQKDKLTADTARMNTEAGMEDSVRDKFGLAKEGEGLIVIVDDENTDKVQLQANSWGVFSFLKNWFK